MDELAVIGVRIGSRNHRISRYSYPTCFETRHFSVVIVVAHGFSELIPGTECDGC